MSTDTSASKTNTKSVVGPEGLRRTLQVLESKGHGNMQVACIGGLNASNVLQVMLRGSPPENPLDGVAVVSAIMAAEDPEAAARHLGDVLLKSTMRSYHPPILADATTGTPFPDRNEKDLLKEALEAIKRVNDQKPLSHNMTNLVC